MSVQIAGNRFGTRGAAIVWVKAQLKTAEVKRPLTGSLLGLAVELHDRVTDLGTPTPDVFMVLEDHNGGRSVRYRDASGEWRGISTAKAVAGEVHSGPDLAKILRAIVRPQTEAFAAAVLAGPNPRCALSGVALTARTDFEVDHVGDTFADISGSWLATIDEPEFVKAPGGGYALAPDQLSDWSLFHELSASYRALATDVHRACSRQQQAARLTLAA